jgi:GWxTD domain-containing protein
MVAPVDRRLVAVVVVCLLPGVAGCASSPVESRYEWTPAREGVSDVPTAHSGAAATDTTMAAAVDARDADVADLVASARRDWLDGPAGLIATAAERERHAALSTEFERETFVREFWARRDRTPGDGVNEARQEFERRVAVAQRAFGSEGEPGWSTGFGMALLVVGFPYNVTLRRGDYEQSRDASFAIPASANNGDEIVWHYVPAGLSPALGAGPIYTDVFFHYIGHRWRMACGPVAWTGRSIVGGTYVDLGLAPPGPTSKVGSSSSSSTDDMGAGMYYGPTQNLMGRGSYGRGWFGGLDFLGSDCEGLWLSALRSWWGI